MFLLANPAAGLRRLTAAAALALPLLAAMPAGSIHSSLIIEAGKQFVLGGDQLGAFKVSGKNTGPVPVEIRERPRDGGIFTKVTLAPGQSGKLSFAAGSTALLLNPSDQKATLSLVVTGDTRRLGMTYEPVGQKTR